MKAELSNVGLHVESDFSYVRGYKKGIRQYSIIILLAVIIIIFTSCGNISPRSPISSQEFEELMETNDFIMFEMPVESPLIRHIEAWGNDFLIQFFEVESISKAQESFDVTVESLRGGYNTLQVNTTDFSYFRTTRGRLFFYLIRVDNIVIYGTSNQLDREELIEFLSPLGNLKGAI